MKEAIACGHQIPLGLCGAIVTLVDEGRLTLDGGIIPFIVCDRRVPYTFDDVKGQSVVCVGPKSHQCPRPEEAHITIVEDVVSV